MLPKYDPDERCAEFTEDVDNVVTQIELSFAIPVHISREHYNMLRDVRDAIVEAPYNQPKEGVHWPSGEGSRPNFSERDAMFLGRPGRGSPDVPDGAEPTFDDSVLAFESAARGFVTEEEREKKLKRRAKQMAKRQPASDIQERARWIDEPDRRCPNCRRWGMRRCPEPTSDGTILRECKSCEWPGFT